MILSPQSVLMAPIHELEARPSIRASRIPMGTLDEVKREHILRALQASGWIVGGPNGAAELLGVKRTSLYKDAKTEYSETHPGLQ
ncbi:helix-turn-helix domain-containing protein [Granulicella sp. S190]|uniref:helix-turn-helix domain-containing protein n=1 Tax=Granulicella sp. S190 TaxID=1747226 RepID=UPI0020B17133|nr:helix-turn-helix domain-containing protein [Granulicella sp. S190]